MDILGIEHIGIAIKSIKNSGSFWELIFKNVDKKMEIIKEQDVKTKIFDTGNGKIELLEGLNDNSLINKFLKEKSSAMHHISIEVKSIEESIKELKEEKVLFVTENWSIGAEGYKIIFIHPKSTGGVLVELTEK
jgi:methylmalonyl-CoA/ethylmalonyl-CoA epimerase